MGFVGGALRERFVEQVRGVEPGRLLAVPVDVGKHSASALVCDFWGEVVAEPFTFELNESGFEHFRGTVARADAARDAAVVRVGVEQAGHYHRTPLARLAEEAGLNTVVFNPAQVQANRAQSLLRTVKSDAKDLGAMAELLARGKGRIPEATDEAIARLQAFTAHRRRKVKARTALKNQVLGTLDLVFPGLQGCFDRLLATKLGRLLVAEGMTPDRVQRLGTERLRAFCARRGVQVQRRKAAQIVGAARDALRLPPARHSDHTRVLAADVELLRGLEGAVGAAEVELAEVLPHTPADILRTIPRVAVVRAAAYGAGVGDPGRFRSAAQVYRLSGLAPRLYESAGRRRRGGISREGKPELREAIIELGKALRQGHPDFARYARELASRGKEPGVVACAVGNRANRVAFAMMRDQHSFEPALWA